MEWLESCDTVSIIIGLGGIAIAVLSTGITVYFGIKAKNIQLHSSINVNIINVENTPRVFY